MCDRCPRTRGDGVCSKQSPVTDCCLRLCTQLRRRVRVFWLLEMYAHSRRPKCVSRCLGSANRPSHRRYEHSPHIPTASTLANQPPQGTATWFHMFAFVPDRPGKPRCRRWYRCGFAFSCADCPNPEAQRICWSLGKLRLIRTRPGETGHGRPQLSHNEHVIARGPATKAEYCLIYCPANPGKVQHVPRTKGCFR